MWEKLQSLALDNSRRAVLQACGLATLLAVLPLSASADTVLTGNTFYAEDFQDSVVGMAPFSSTGEVEWLAVGQGSRTVVREDPADSNNLVLKSDGADTTNGTSTGRRVRFSSNMVNNVPSSGSVSFRFHFSELFHVDSFLDPAVFLVMDDINGNVQNSNTAFGLKINPTDTAPGKLTLSSNEVFTGGNFADLVLGEWINATIDYNLASTVDNVSISLTSASLGTISHTLSSDISSMNPSGFFVFNPASFEEGAGDVFMLDDIVWQEASTGGGIAGDFNNNGVVDAADYTLWLDNLGAGDESSLNSNGDGLNGVDQADYALWKSSFGNTSGVGTGSSEVPEPISSLLLILGIGSSLLVRRRRS